MLVFSARETLKWGIRILSEGLVLFWGRMGENHTPVCWWPYRQSSPFLHKWGIPGRAGLWFSTCRHQAKCRQWVGTTWSLVMLEPRQQEWPILDTYSQHWFLPCFQFSPGTYLCFPQSHYKYHLFPSSLRVLSWLMQANLISPSAHARGTSLSHSIVRYLSVSCLSPHWDSGLLGEDWFVCIAEGLSSVCHMEGPCRMLSETASW